MKMALMLIAGLCAGGELMAQICSTGGLITFRTFISPAGLKAQLTLGDGSPVVGPAVAGGPGWYAELLYSATATDSLQPISGFYAGSTGWTWTEAAREPFRSATGYVLGHEWMLDGVPQARYGWFAVAGYYAPTGKETFSDIVAVQPDGTGRFAVSERISVVPGGYDCPTTPMPAAGLVGLQSWVVPVPEPNVTVLGVLGLLAICVGNPPSGRSRGRGPSHRPVHPAANLSDGEARPWSSVQVRGENRSRYWS